MTTPEHAEAISGKYHWSFAKNKLRKMDIPTKKPRKLSLYNEYDAL
jgi:hypothetical protein